MVAAVAFGVTLPIVERAGREVGPLSTAALLYFGACLSALRVRGARPHLKRFFVIALFGAAIAPALLAWGLQRTGATAASLLLNLEAAFTVLLARAFYREPIGRRVTMALFAMLIGGVALALESRDTAWSFYGALAVVGATA